MEEKRIVPTNERSPSKQACFIVMEAVRNIMTEIDEFAGEDKKAMLAANFLAVGSFVTGAALWLSSSEVSSLPFFTAAAALAVVPTAIHTYRLCTEEATRFAFVGGRTPSSFVASRAPGLVSSNSLDMDEPRRAPDPVSSNKSDVDGLGDDGYCLVEPPRQEM